MMQKSKKFEKVSNLADLPTITQKLIVLTATRIIGFGCTLCQRTIIIHYLLKVWEHEVIYIELFRIV